MRNKLKIEKVQKFRYNGIDFDTEAEAIEFAQSEFKDGLKNKIRSYLKDDLDIEKLYQLIGNLSQRELTVIRNIVHNNRKD